MKLPSCYSEHLDSLRLGYAKRLMSWVGLYGNTTGKYYKTFSVLFLSLCLVSEILRGSDIYRSVGVFSPRRIGVFQGAVSFWNDCTRLLLLLNCYQTIWSLPRRRHNRVTKAAWMNTLNIIKFFIFRDMKKSLKVSLTYSNTKHVLILLQRYLCIWEWKRFTFFVEVKSIYCWWAQERKVSEGWH